MQINPPLDGHVFSVQTNIADILQGIRYYVRTDPTDSDGTLVNINIPKKSGEALKFLYFSLVWYEYPV